MNDARIVLVNDRVDLDKQIKGTFKNTGMSPERAATGRDLISLIAERKASVITTIINKFEAAARDQLRDEARDVLYWLMKATTASMAASARRCGGFPKRHLYRFYWYTHCQERPQHDGRVRAHHRHLHHAMRKDGAVLELVYEGRLIKPDMDEKGSGYAV